MLLECGVLAGIVLLGTMVLLLAACLVDQVGLDVLLLEYALLAQSALLSKMVLLAEVVFHAKLV